MDYTERLRCLAINDARLAEDWVGAARVEADALDPKTLALVRLAALVAVGGAVPSFGAHADAAVSAGATAAEIVEVLIGVIPIVGLLLAALLDAVSRRARWGVAMLAVVQNRDAARLMGIPSRRVVALAFAMSAVFAGVAGVLIAPLLNVNADMGTLFGLKAFAVAILGGIGSPWGVMIAGLLFGILESLITSTLGSSYTQIISFGLVIVALALRPNGLFGRAEVKKV